MPRPPFFGELRARHYERHDPGLGDAPSFAHGIVHSREHGFPNVVSARRSLLGRPPRQGSHRRCRSLGEPAHGGGRADPNAWSRNNDGDLARRWPERPAERREGVQSIGRSVSGGGSRVRSVRLSVSRSIQPGAQRGRHHREHGGELSVLVYPGPRPSVCPGVVRFGFARDWYH